MLSTVINVVFMTLYTLRYATVCSRQLGEITVSVANAVLPPLVPQAFAIGLVILCRRVIRLRFFNCKSDFQRCVKNVFFYT